MAEEFGLVLERRDQEDRTPAVTMGGGRATVMITPMLGEDYWQYRVRLGDPARGQSVVGFPKFGTIGVGFAIEDADWNTNLPYTCSAEQIQQHIMHNAGDPAIRAAMVVAAITLIQQAATEDREEA